MSGWIKIMKAECNTSLIAIGEAHLILCKDNESRVQCKFN